MKKVIVALALTIILYGCGEQSEENKEMLEKVSKVGENNKSIHQEDWENNSTESSSGVDENFSIAIENVESITDEALGILIIQNSLLMGNIWFLQQVTLAKFGFIILIQMQMRK